MRNIFGLQIETKVSLAIVILVAVVMLVTVFKSIDSFNKFSSRINHYEELRVEKGK